MKKLNEFNTLTEAQEYVYEVDTKQVGAGQARGFFVFTGIWATLRAIQADTSHQLYSLADATILTASDANSYFGMDEDKTEGVANRAGIATYVAAGVMTQSQADDFIAKTLTTSTPYEGITQEEFDAAAAELAAQGETSYSELLYNTIPAAVNGHFVSANFRGYNFAVKLHATTEFDTTIQIKLASKTSFGDWVEEPNTITIPVKAGQQPALNRVIKKYTRHTKVLSATIGLANTQFDLEVYGEQ